MKLYIKQKVFSFKDHFSVYEVDQTERYTVEGEIFTLGKKLHLYDTFGTELAFIHQKLWSFLPCFYIEQNGIQLAEVNKELSFMKPRYTVSGPDWEVEGNFWGHEFTITAAGRTVATISKEWMTWGDTYCIDIRDDRDELLALCTLLVIDAVIAQQQQSAAN